MTPENKALYKTKEWLIFRDKCLKKAGFQCERCGNNDILQVHHPEYKSGLKPWEYHIEFCEVLCRGCHAAEHGIILPREGWIILYSDYENNEPSGAVPCAKCQRSVTWHVHIYHPNWGETIVGSSCGENLSLGPEFSAIKSRHRRLLTFVNSPRWTIREGSWHIIEDHNDIAIYDLFGHYGLEINYKWGNLKYRTPEEAKIRAFEFVENRRVKRAAQAGNESGP